MRWTVLTQAHRVMGKDVNSALFHERRHANRISRVFHEDKEGATVGNESTVQCNAIHHGCHGEFPNAVINVVALGIRCIGTGSTGPQCEV